MHLRVVEAQRQLDDGGLAAARGAAQGDDGARLDGEAHPIEDEDVGAFHTGGSNSGLVKAERRRAAGKERIRAS